MVNIRQATSRDSEIIGQQRVRMFADAGIADEERTGPMLKTFVPWVLTKLQDGSYIGWLAEHEGQVVGGAGLWLMEFPPNWMDEQPLRAYLLNFFVVPAMRRQGLARQLLELSLAEAKARGVKVVTLAASKFGRPLYEQYGFKATNEMILRLRHD